MITPEQLVEWFSVHKLTPEAEDDQEMVRKGALAFSLIILKATPPSADQTAALRKVREAVSAAHDAIALRSK